MTALSVALLAASLAAVVLLGISAGVHVSGVAALNPALRALDPLTYVAVKQSTDRHFPTLMKPLTLTGLGALLAQTVLAVLHGQAGVAVPAVVGLFAAAVALVAVLRGDLPINQQMASWTGATRRRTGWSGGPDGSATSLSARSPPSWPLWPRSPAWRCSRKGNANGALRCGARADRWLRCSQAQAEIGRAATVSLEDVVDDLEVNGRCLAAITTLTRDDRG